jgi:hypothetical protein
LRTSAGIKQSRFAFTDDQQAHDQHERLQGALVEEARCPIELRHGGHYGAIEIDDPSKTGGVLDILAPHHSAGYLMWEWADRRSRD